MELRPFNLDDYRQLSVKEMNSNDQPREKLMRYGADSLSDAELLAIVLRTGSRKLNVIEMSRALLGHFGGLRNLCRQNWQSLKVIPGIAGVKSITLQAVFELAKRIQVASLGEEVVINSPDAAAAYFVPMLRDLPHEVFIVAFLNNAKVLTGYQKLSQGGKKSTVVDIPDIFRAAMLHHADSIILVHNHPSGQTNPSAADISLTRKVREASHMIGITMEDHIIVAENDYVSFRNQNLI
ncbi:MAG: RadC family protein [Balneolaceae bacterium]